MLKKAILFLLLSQLSIAQNYDIDLLKNINQNRNQSWDKPLFEFNKTVYPMSFALSVGTWGIGLISKNKQMKRKGFDMISSVVVSAGTTYLLKKVIARPRPYETYPFIQNYYADTDYAMPSGHTTLAFSTATSLSIAYPKWYVIVPAYAWAGSVAYSRMHLGMHYPTDVLAGAAIGAGSAWITYKANKWIRKKTRVLRVLK